MEKTLLDKVTDDRMVKCYSESEILNREVIGRGGFGVVYKVKLKHTVAVKSNGGKNATLFFVSNAINIPICTFVYYTKLSGRTVI